MVGITVFWGVLLSSGLDGVAAQTTRPLGAGSSGFTAVGLQFEEQAPQGPSWSSRLASGLAGAAIGAGLGYFASQVSRGDWDEGGGRKEINRSAWAAVGGAGGFVLGLSIPLWGRPPGGGASPPAGADRFLITGEDIRDASVTNALEAVNLFHPEWLVRRGQGIFQADESDDIRVYLDEVPLGGVETLQGLSPLIIDFIRFYDPQRATARWGANHGRGAIQVVTLS
jgi:hypothetical protein